MVDPSVWGLVGAGVGALAVLAGGYVLEGRRVAAERRAMAMSVAGAIEAEIWAIRRRGHVAFLQAYLRQIEGGDGAAMRGFAPRDPLRNPYLEAFVPKLGLLGGELPGHVIRFNQVMWGIRVDLARLTAGEFGTDRKAVAQVLKEDIGLFEEMEAFGTELARRLRRSAGW